MRFYCLSAKCSNREASRRLLIWLPRANSRRRVFHHFFFCIVNLAHRKYLLIACLLLIVFSSNSALSQTVTDSSRYRLLLIARDKAPAMQWSNNNSRRSRTEIERDIQQSLERLLRQQYYDARLDSISFQVTPQPEARVYIHAGPQYELKLMAAFADSGNSNRDWQRELRGKHAEEEWLARMQTVLEDFARRGYPLAYFVLDSVNVRAAEIGKKREAILHFQLHAGPVVRLDSIIVTGNKTTKTYVLLRELPLRNGEIYNLEEVQNIRARLLRLGFIREVVPELRVNQRGQYVLEVAITEGNNNTLNGVVGYNPAAGKQRGFLTGLIDIRLGNLFGTGRQMHVHWEKKGPETQALGLRYEEPWVRGYPVHFSTGFQQLLQDTLYVERKFDLSAEAPIRNRLTALAAFTRESVVPDSLSALSFNLPSSQINSVVVGLHFDSRDEMLNPRTGFFYSTTLATGRKRVQSNASVQHFTHKLVALDLQWLVPTKWPQVMSLAFHGQQVTSGEPVVSLTDQIRFGGATTLRGYREEQFRGSRVAWSNIEYRYLLSRYSRAYLFFDVGYFFREEASPAPSVKFQIESVKTSFGLGVRWETPVGIVGMDYGLGEGDGLFNGKVHVSLVNSF